jgi:acetylornithine deacetylase
VTNIDPDALTTVVDELEPEIVAFLQEIVRIPSLTGQEAAVQVPIAAKMRGMGLTVDVWEPDPVEMSAYARDIGEINSFAGRPNVVGVLPAAGEGRSLILNAHIDVVDAGDETAWSHSPFGADLVDGAVVGRGSCDMKAGLVENLFALEALRRLGLRPNGEVIVQSVISEEDGGAGTLACIARGYKADGVIITEPTRLAAVVAQGGSLVFRLHVPGRSAHGAARDEGVSAVEKFAYLHRALLAFEAQRNRELTHPLYAPIANKIPISIGVVRAGTWPSSVPESLIAEGRAGLVPGEDLDAFAVEFVAVIDAAADADPWLAEHRPWVEWFSGQFAPAEIDPEAPLIRSLLSAHQTANGTSAEVQGVPYGADMRHFIHAGGMPCAMYGAGDVRLAHYTNESVPIDEVKAVVRTLTLLIADWCGVGPIA